MKLFDWDGMLATYFGNGSNASFLGVGIYGKYNKTRWHKMLVRPVWNVGHKLHNAMFWFRYRCVKKHKYHLIDTKLKPSYYDIDHIMLHGMFALLDRYVDQEHNGVTNLESWGNELLGDKTFMSESSSRQGNKELEAVALYRWWHEERPADLKHRNKLMHSLYNDKTFETKPVEGFDLHEYISPRFDKNEEIIHKELDELEIKIKSEEQIMLHRLIDIRTGLWT